MRRFRIVFAVVSLGVLLPTVFFVDRALQSVALERQLRQQAVAERIFDEMERSLSSLLVAEERQPIDDYTEVEVPESSPLVVARFEVLPNGTVASGRSARSNEVALRPLRDFWRSGRPVPSPPAAAAQQPGTTVRLDRDSADGNVEVEKDELAGAKKAAEPERQRKAAAKSEVSAFDALRALNTGVEQRAGRMQKSKGATQKYEAMAEAEGAASAPLPDRAPAAEQPIAEPYVDPEPAPLNGRLLDARRLMLYRTVVRGTQALRQGVLLDVERLGIRLRESALGNEDLESFASVSFSTGNRAFPAATGSAYRHRFAEPFDDLTALLTLQALPGAGRDTYTHALAGIVLLTALLGLGALYRMVSVTVGYSERRANFVAAVSHELKTPLTAIRMYGEMLRDGIVPSDAKRNEYYRHITVESERLSRLINNVLELSQLEKGTRQLALGVAPVEPVLREVADLVRPHVAAQGFELNVSGGEYLPPIRFERDALVQILFNLVDNAAKYAREATDRRIELAASHAAGTVRLAVRDHGPGVPTRHLGRIFEPFYRGESELTRRNKGTGIGLALVRGLAERMGARVSARNLDGEGFEVALEFPVA